LTANTVAPSFDNRFAVASGRTVAGSDLVPFYLFCVRRTLNIYAGASCCVLSADDAVLN
jgi:hypothetical protein